MKRRTDRNERRSGEHTGSAQLSAACHKNPDDFWIIVQFHNLDLRARRHFNTGR